MGGFLGEKVLGDKDRSHYLQYFSAQMLQSRCIRHNTNKAARGGSDKGPG